MKEQWCWSLHKEVFMSGPIPSKEEAIKEAFIENEMGDTVYIGKTKEVCITKYTPCASWIIERMEESAFDDLGECTESWLDNVTGEQQGELQELIDNVIKNWAIKHKQTPSFYEVTDITEHVVPEKILEKK